MIWLTWRQARVQAITGAVTLALLALIFGLTGPGLAHMHAVDCAVREGCTARFLAQMKADSVYPLLYFTGALVMYAAPLLIGMFWGAPLLARELEAGTFRLAWNQSVSRVRWLAVKLALTGLAAMTWAGLASLLLTWWVSPIDDVGGFPAGTGQLSRFAAPLFVTRGIVPVGAAALACAAGVTAGLLIRRVVPAMAVTMAVFAAILVIMPHWVTPHLEPPVRVTRPVTYNPAGMDVTSNGQINDPVTSEPGAWILSDQVTTRSGAVFTVLSSSICQTGTQRQCDAWLASQPLLQHISYQPASRYWPFQWLETAIFLVCALGLSVLCLRLI